jgi:hypothetical protein
MSSFRATPTPVAHRVLRFFGLVRQRSTTGLDPDAVTRIINAPPLDLLRGHARYRSGSFSADSIAPTRPEWCTGQDPRLAISLSPRALDRIARDVGRIEP